MNLKERLFIREDLLSEEIDGEVVVLDLAGDKYFSLNQVGVVIWQALENGGATLEEILARMLEEFEVDEEIAREDAILFLHSLREANLLRTGLK